MADPAYRLIDQEAAWQTLLPQIRGASALAVDMEADGFHRYPEQVALIQVGLPDGRLLLLDPLALKDLSGLGEALADPKLLTVFHSASYDVRALDRDFGFHIGALYDTSIAAQLLGLERTGLANVLLEILGVEMDNKSKRLQRMDWSIRPLPEDAMAYAADDVAWLLALQEALAARIAALGRQAWVAEECRRLSEVRHEAPAPPEAACLTMKGARDLSPRGRAVLRELIIFREAEALAMGRPPHYVMHNQAMLTLAEAPDTPIDRIQGIGRRTLGRRSSELRAALARGKAAPPLPWPKPAGRNPWTPEARDRLTALKRWRQAEADRLALSAGLIWPARHLDQVALWPDRPPRELDLGEPSWIRDWQWAELGESLMRFLAQQGWTASPTGG